LSETAPFPWTVVSKSATLPVLVFRSTPSLRPLLRLPLFHYRLLTPALHKHGSRDFNPDVPGATGSMIVLGDPSTNHGRSGATRDRQTGPGREGMTASLGWFEGGSYGPSLCHIHNTYRRSAGTVGADPDLVSRISDARYQAYVENIRFTRRIVVASRLTLLCDRILAPPHLMACTGAPSAPSPQRRRQEPRECCDPWAVDEVGYDCGAALSSLRRVARVG
jgi:hypothetical protein